MANRTAAGEPGRANTAFLPVTVSLAAAGLVLGYVALFGVVRQPDEGTPKTASQSLALQVAAWLAPVALVAFLGL